MENKKVRESGIELLKIIAILIIILSHSLPFPGGKEFVSYINLDISSSDLNTIIMLNMRVLGQIGNVIFIVCSAYFLAESKKIKLDKVFKIIFDATIISLLYFFIIAVKKGVGYNKISWAASFFPTIYRENYWFICCYLLLYLMHPILNIVSENLTRRKLLLLNICLFTLYSVINMMYEKTFFYTELVGFIEIYFIVIYMKKYMNNFSKSIKKNITNLITSVILLFIFIIGINTVGTKDIYYSGKVLYWCDISNPFIILMVISLFNLFKKLKFKSGFVNFFASLSLLIYMFTDNYFMREYINPYFFLCNYGRYNAIILVLIRFLYLTCIAVILSIIYKFSIKVFTDKFSENLVSKFTKTGRKLLDKLEKID